MSAIPTGVSPLRADDSSDHATATPLNTSENTVPSSISNQNSRDTSSHVEALQTATSVASIRATLKALHARNNALTVGLDALVASHSTTISPPLSRLDTLRASLGAQVVATRTIGNNMLSRAADTAGRLSDRVRELDLEKSRVEQTLGVVEQVTELRACVHGVIGSMGAPQNWEAAAGYLARATETVPDDIVRSGFAARIVPSVEVPDPPWTTLENAKESLCVLFLREFEAAAKADDGTKVTRFFKLFPLIGRGDVGLDVYGRYVCQGVAGTARATLKEATGSASGAAESSARKGVHEPSFVFAGALTKLFEHIAQIVDGHGALVERHYGAGKMVRVVERLQMEADVQGGIILDSWADERAVERLLTDVKSYPFSFLVQSFLPGQPRGGMAMAGMAGMAAGMGIPRINSPALGAVSSAGTAGMNTRNSEDEGVNMKEIDGLLNEISVMLGRWSLYMRFLAGKCRDPSTPDDSLTVPGLLTKSNLHRKVASKLATPYNVMTTFFFRRSVEKAFQLDESPTGLTLHLSKAIEANPPFIISAVDVVMYIVNAVLQRTLSTCQRDVMAAAVLAVGRVLGSDFIGMIQRRMRDESSPKPLVQGGLPPEDKVVAFIVLVNSLELANEYLGRVISGIIGPRSGRTVNGSAVPVEFPQFLKDSFPFDRDADAVVSSLAALESSFVSKTTELLNEGVSVLFNQVVKLRLRQVLSETFRDADFGLSEEELIELEREQAEDDPDRDPGDDGDGGVGDLLHHGHVVRRFELGWDQLMKPIGRILAPRPFAMLLDQAARNLGRVLEKRVWSYAGGRASAFGAMRMERDFEGIVGAVARGNYAVREMFGRVSQVLMVANMEDDEWEELRLADGDEQDDGGFLWLLSEDERRRARSLVKG